MQLSVKEFSVFGFSANAYALESGNDIALIDIGAPTKQILEYVKANSKRIRYILLTHDHFDHICGVENVLEYCNAKICIHKNDVSGLTDSNYSLCKMAGMLQPTIKADVLLTDGDLLRFGKGEIKVMHTPGHTDGSVCYILGELMFSGDTLFFESVGRTDFITGNGKELLQSLKRITALSGIKKVYTGHGESTTIEHERTNNFYLNYEGIY